MLDTPATTRPRTPPCVARDHPRHSGPVRAIDPQLKARALLALFCRDDVLEQRMSPEVKEILGILSRGAAAKPYHGPISRRSNRRH